MKKNNFLGTVILVLITSALNAQIIYTDIPDGIPTGIDFNSDGIPEFDVSTLFNPGDYITYTRNGPDTDNNIHAIGPIPNHDVPDCVSAGFTINASNSWEGFGDVFVNGVSSPNPTITVNQDEYIAVRFNLGTTDTDIYYGWIRFVLDDMETITYKDYAYESTPGASINAGDTGDATLSVNDFEMNTNFTIYPNPAQNIITIDNTSGINISEIWIVDLLGKKVNKKLVSNLNKQTIDVSELNKGIYLAVLFNNENQIGSKRISIK